MSETVIWFLLFGFLFLCIGIFYSNVRRLPLTAAMIYLPVGYLLGPQMADLIDINPLREAKLLEHVTEVVVILSLFTSGLKLRTPVRLKHWGAALRLASVSMIVTIGGIALFSFYVLSFPLGLSILLGAILAPTDPVLASDVQVQSPTDRDPLKFSLTGEAGLNDGTAFPFVMLGLGLMGVHELGEGGIRWIAVDLLWSIAAGISIGAAMGYGVAKFVLSLRTRNEESVVLDDFLTIGLICVSYGTALLCHSYGFLAVFAAGVALRNVERMHSEKQKNKNTESTEPAKMAKAVLTFNEQLERLGEVLAVIIIGSLVELSFFTSNDIWLLPVLFLVIRPLAVYIGLYGHSMPTQQKQFISWFGIRGIGSIYYLTYAVVRLPEASSTERIVELVLAASAISILVHGISATPLMNFYHSRRHVGPAKVPAPGV